MAHSGWRVTGQATDQVINTDAGKTETGVYVYFVTGDGNSGVVFVANRHYNHKTVKKVVDAQAHLIDTVGNLAAGANTQDVAIL